MEMLQRYGKIRSLYCHSLGENIGIYAFHSPGEKEFDFYLMKELVCLNTRQK